MFLPYISILTFSVLTILAEHSLIRDGLLPTSRPPPLPSPSPPSSPPPPSSSSPRNQEPDEDKSSAPGPLTTEPCRGPGCQPPPNLVAILVGSLCGIFIVALIGVFIAWFYFRRKHKKRKQAPIIPVINCIEQPALYTGTISTTDSSSRLYGMTPTRNDSISSHLYEKIKYYEQS